MSTVAEDFWRDKTVQEFNELENVWGCHQRLSYDVENVLPYVRKSKSIFDISCGNANLVRILDEILHFESVGVADINCNVLRELLPNTPDHWLGRYCNLNTSLPSIVKQYDAVLWTGSMHYILDDLKVKETIYQCEDQVLIIRVPCCPTEEGERHINTMSEAFNGKYEAKYRSPDTIKRWMDKVFKCVFMDTIYPKNIDSKWGTTQYLFVGVNDMGRIYDT